MNLHTKLTLLAFVSACLYTGSAVGQPVAEKPNWKVGDYWEYQQTSTQRNLDTSGIRWRKIEALVGEEIHVRSEDGALEKYDSAMNWMPDGRADLTRVWTKYPLRVGAEWTYSTKANAMEGTGNLSLKVVAYESITVPAGTFACYRIEGAGTYGNKTYLERYAWTRWICPEIKWFAKERWEVTTINPGGISGTNVRTRELLKFTPGG